MLVTMYLTVWFLGGVWLLYWLGCIAEPMAFGITMVVAVSWFLWIFLFFCPWFYLNVITAP